MAAAVALYACAPCVGVAVGEAGAFDAVTLTKETAPGGGGVVAWTAAA